MPNDTKPFYTLIADQSAHLDWDWIRTFAQNFWYYKYGQGVNDILTTTISLTQSKDGAYYYTVCEMGFFRRFIEENPSAIASIRALGANFQVISGGVTSADCLVCSSEGFIRNYLVGQVWLQATLGMTAKPHCWLPDDFGQGPELPTLLAALGFESVAFSRLPGTLPSCYRPDLKNDLLAHGLDFRWIAADGSQVFGHWIDPKYGNKLTDTSDISTFIDTNYGKTSASPPTYTGAATPYMYVSIDDDFSMPETDLLGTLDSWNVSSASSANVTAIDGTFDQFMNHVSSNSHEFPLKSRSPYNGTPYWTGYYASRPELKTLHYETIRALTAAEVIGLLTKPHDDTLNSMLPTDFWSRVDQAWIDFTPSTHHDYICGTAPDAVYAGDQLPLLRGAAAAARSLRDQALNALGGMACGVSNGQSGSLIVVNPLGFSRGGVAAIEDVAPVGESVTLGSVTSRSQPSADGGMLLYAETVPGFGYVTGSAAGQDADPTDAVTISPATSGASSYTLQNEYLSATISSDADWGISALVDRKNANANVLSGSAPGNSIVFYYDSGGLYQFANELDFNESFKPCSASVTSNGAGLGAVVVEQGPLRARLRTEVEIDVEIDSDTGTTTYKKRFVREYILCLGEPYLRMRTTGAAPPCTSVMTKFPLQAAVTSITIGTGYHWTSEQPMSGFWGPPTFQAAHDFLLPQGEGSVTLAAAYHAGMPAWAFDSEGALIGCLLRNTPSSDGHGAQGSDPAPHTQHYALRVPTGLGAPASGQPLQEALGFHTPLLAAWMPPSNQYDGMLNASSASLASLPEGSAAVMTAAKPGSYDPSSLVLRLYQPTNNQQILDVTLPSRPRSVQLLTAAETTWLGNGSVTQTSGGFAVTMPYAIATVQIGGLGRKMHD